MNGKKARNIRKMVEKTLGHLPEIAYQDIERKPRLVETGKFNPDGTQQRVVYTPTTRILKDCQREVYQQLKNMA